MASSFKSSHSRRSRFTPTIRSFLHMSQPQPYLSLAASSPHLSIISSCPLTSLSQLLKPAYSSTVPSRRYNLQACCTAPADNARACLKALIIRYNQTRALVMFRAVNSTRTPHGVIIQYYGLPEACGRSNVGSCLSACSNP